MKWSDKLTYFLHLRNINIVNVGKLSWLIYWIMNAIPKIIIPLKSQEGKLTATMNELVLTF